MLRILRCLGGHVLALVLLLLLGIVPQVHAIGPAITPVLSPAYVGTADESRAVVLVFLAPYRAHGPPAVLAFVCVSRQGDGFVVRGAGRSAWRILYAYAGGDPVNRWDPSGLDDIVFEGADVYWVSENEGSWLALGVQTNTSQREKIGTRKALSFSVADYGVVYDSDTVYLDDDLGGGSISTNELIAAADKAGPTKGDRFTMMMAMFKSVRKARGGAFGPKGADRTIVFSEHFYDWGRDTVVQGADFMAGMFGDYTYLYYGGGASESIPDSQEFERKVGIDQWINNYVNRDSHEATQGRRAAVAAEVVATIALGPETFSARAQAQLWRGAAAGASATILIC